MSAQEKAINLHLAERDPQHHSWAKNGADKQSMKLKILLSYHYYKNIDLDELFAKYFTEPYPDVLLDSGAWSAFTSGVEISLDDYCKFVRRFEHLFCHYINLDDMNDPEISLKNQNQMMDRGLNPVPVFHTGEPWHYLEQYIQDYSYVALGKIIPYTTSPKVIIPWILKAFKMAGSQTVFHGLGVTNWKLVRFFKWYSVDSSSWGSGFRFGRVPIFDEQKGRFVSIPLGDGRKWARHGRLVRSLGFDPLDFADRERNDRAKICAISALSYMMAERWLRKLHGPVTIPGLKGAPAGLRGHLADANPARLKEASQGVGLYLADTSSGINYRDADKGIKLHLVDALSHGRYPGHAQTGLKIHLAEHSLDRGGVGDTSRAMELLDNGGNK